jgi:hypothetical protein
MSFPTFQNIHTLQRTATKARSNGRDATNLSGAFMVIYISVYRLRMVVRSPGRSSKRGGALAKAARSGMALMAILYKGYRKR